MKVRCPDCGSKGALNADLAGQMVRCSQCGSKFVATELPMEEGVKWYYAEAEEKKGPLSGDEFARLIAAGAIAPDTLVWCKGMQGWQTLAASRGEDAVLLHHEEEASAPAESAGARVPGEAKEANGTIPASWPAGLLYASAGKRLLAKVIDLVFMFTMAALVEAFGRKLFPAVPGSAAAIDKVYIVIMLIDMLLGMFYITWFVGKFGATPGKMVFSLKVVTASGGRVGYGHAFGRYWAEFVVIWLTLMLGYLPLVFDAQKRGLHDRLCNTRVVQISS